ncbi:hypothetical protein TrVE_jg321 [Triparma verrucosa]|uniref:Saccharopine dehydrogenase NADP binding domain-containing protein n=1 Tax=Triparma verrucosa TaxID=1606542 RepID=A0A9W7EPM7_9STRA|nr:hypothetical protein TrVE_jg321 [Triparma verrucosa]
MLRALILSLIFVVAGGLASVGSRHVLILGGSGRIGTATAIHFLTRDPSLHIRLAGRNAQRGQKAVDEVNREVGRAGWCDFVSCDYTSEVEMSSAVEGMDAVVHVAGPFVGPNALRPLQLSLAAGVGAYVDVSDPIEYLDAARKMHSNSTVAVLCAGAFPGMSNVLAMEVASLCDGRTKDLNFSYFTAGLGGSGTVNLDITNYGFGEPVPRCVEGEPVLVDDYAGSDLGRVNFYFDDDNVSDRERIGNRACWAWPFPEAFTVASKLNISGSSRAGMGTAPAVWNDMLRLLVEIVPRRWWRTAAFSGGMARFSEPLVKATDLFVGETHAMRIDVTSDVGERSAAVQSHESFRRCVGQSCAEFCLDILNSKSIREPGVYLPEDLYEDAEARERIIKCLTTTPGTTAYRSAKIYANK